MDRFRRKLAGWKEAVQAGKFQLIKPTLQSLPIYASSVIKLPGKISKSINQICEKFLRMCMSLVTWKSVCQPRDLGGLGIRKMKEFNKALIEKLALRLIQDDKATWIQICKAKYLEGVESRLIDPNSLPRGSTFQNGLHSYRDFFQYQIKKKVKSGLHTRFWQDLWLEPTPFWISGCLLTLLIGQLTILDYG